MLKQLVTSNVFSGSFRPPPQQYYGGYNDRGYGRGGYNDRRGGWNQGKKCNTCFLRYHKFTKFANGSPPLRHFFGAVLPRR